jgi:hypothetical protein
MQPMPVLPAEARLLVFATRSTNGEDDRALDRLISQPLDWRRIGEMAEREKLLPVLWNRLRGHTGRVPPEIADRIHAQAAVTEFRMAMTETTLQDALEVLASAGIRVLLLKGAALATTVYPSFAARPMGDVDILVQPGEARRAWNLLVSAGWRPELAGGERFFEGHHHLVGLVDPKGLNLALEVHRGMLPTPGPFQFDEAEVWRDARPVKLGTSEAWVPSDQHQLLHLCVHFAWSHMLLTGIGRTVRDVATMLERGEIDWEGFIALARRTRAATCAYWTLAMSRTLAAARVPESVLASLRPGGPVALTNALERAQISSALLGACPSIHLMRAMWSAEIRPDTSRHGSVRPWQVGEAFMEAFHLGHRPGRMARLKAHLHGWTAWLRFAGIFGIPRPIV